MVWGLLALVLAGCVQVQATGVTIAEVDSTRWVTPEKDQPYALTWGYSKLNLWMRVVAGTWCRVGTLDEYHRLGVNVAGTAELPLFWTTGAPIHGTWTAIADTADVYAGGSFDVQVVEDTLLVGSATLILRSPCGVQQTEQRAIRLVRVP